VRDETPTPRESTASERARVFRAVALDLARRLDRMADDAVAAGKPRPAVRLLAGRAIAMADDFETWLTGTASLEHRAKDMARWRDVQAEAREMGVR
jgi:hypothetical protein